MTVRASPPVLLKLAGLASTRRVDSSRWRTYCFVVVLPYDPVIATTIGATRRRRALAWATNAVRRRASRGLVMSNAASTTSGWTIASTATPVGSTAGVRSTDAATAATTVTARSMSTHAPPSSRMREVHTSADVRPGIDRRSGAMVIAAAVASAAGGNTTDPTAPATATRPSARSGGVPVHQRPVKRRALPR